MFEFLQRWKEDLKAFRRGERRVAPGMRGRVYERKRDSGPNDGVKRSGHQARVKLSAAVTRAAGGIEHYDIIDGKAVRVD